MNKRVSAIQTQVSALSLIRKSTRRLHAKLDKDSVMSVLASPLCNVHSYQRAMRGLAIAYQHVDSALISAHIHCPAELMVYHPRLPFILADLSAMGLLQPDMQVANILVPSSRAEYLGMRYVIEGAQLGSRVIERNLSQSDIASLLTNARQFWSSGLAWQRGWPLLLNQLSTLQNRTELAQSVRAARSTFQHFIASLSTVAE